MQKQSITANYYTQTNVKHQ